MNAALIPVAADSGLSDLLSTGSSAELQEAFSGDRSLLGDPDFIRAVSDFAKDFASLALLEDDAAVLLCRQMYPNQSMQSESPWFLAYVPEVTQQS